jgi:hypothetical protein
LKPSWWMDWKILLNTQSVQLEVCHTNKVQKLYLL